MKVKFNTSIAGEAFAYRHGEIADVEDEIGKKWLASGICAPASPASFSASCPNCGNKFEAAAPQEPVKAPEQAKTPASEALKPSPKK